MNGLLNNFSNVNLLPFPDSIKSDSLRGKRSGETTNQDSHCYILILRNFVFSLPLLLILEHALRPSLNLNLLGTYSPDFKVNEK